MQCLAHSSYSINCNFTKREKEKLRRPWVLERLRKGLCSWEAEPGSEGLRPSYQVARENLNSSPSVGKNDGNWININLGKSSSLLKSKDLLLFVPVSVPSGSYLSSTLPISCFQISMKTYLLQNLLFYPPATLRLVFLKSSFWRIPTLVVHIHEAFNMNKPFYLVFCLRLLIVNFTAICISIMLSL